MRDYSIFIPATFGIMVLLLLAAAIYFGVAK
jgi:hypothetical protein